MSPVSATRSIARSVEGAGFGGCPDARWGQRPIAPSPWRAHHRRMANIQPTNTTAFLAQSAISFAVSVTAVLIGVVYLPVNGWMRAFLAVGMLYVVTSTFTLAKCVRDLQEQSRVVHRIDEA